MAAESTREASDEMAPDLFSQWVRERRKALRLTQSQLADLAGLSLSAMEKLEGGQRRPSEQVAKLLAEALHVAPKVRARFLRLAVGGRGWSEGESETAEISTPTNLPSYLTPLVGRDGALAGITALLKDRQARLVTLTGPPGVGKTRLALQVGHALLTDFEKGVFSVALAPVRDASLVMRAIAEALGLHDRQNESIALTLKTHLQEQKVLLVLDNFEQVVSAAPSVVDLLWSCTGVQILVTSREALHVRGERVFSVPPLDREAAIQLFTERAREVDSSFELTVETLPAVEAICARVEGVPLAIELLAARVTLLPPKALLARFDKHEAKQGRASARSFAGAQRTLPLLVGGPRDLPERHRTLHSAIGWSYDLLSPSEQRLFSRLGVFEGGFTVASAEAICNAGSDLGVDMLSGIEQLLRKNLLKPHDHSGEAKEEEPRFGMLETIREYALEQLKAKGELEEVLLLHAEYYLAVAHSLPLSPLGDTEVAMLRKLDADHENLRAAMSWLVESGRINMAAELGISLVRYWHLRGHFSEGQEWLMRVVDAQSALGEVDAAGAGTSVALYMSAAVMSLYMHNLLQARSLLEAGVSLLERFPPEAVAWREWTSGVLAIHLRIQLGNVARLQGDYERAIPLYESCVELSRAAEQGLYLASSLWSLGLSLGENGDLESGEALLRESLTLARQINDSYIAHGALRDLGLVLCYRGDYAGAVRCVEESLDVAKRANLQVAPSWSLLALGLAAMGMKQHVKAGELLRESIRLARNTVMHRIPQCLEALARLEMEMEMEDASRQAGVRHAATLMGAAEATRLILGTRTPPVSVVIQQGLVEEISAQLGAEEYERAYNAGLRMNLDEAVAVAQSDRCLGSADIVKDGGRSHAVSQTEAESGL